MLIFTLKKEWYEKIKSGEKTIEYREVKPYWIKRIEKEINWNITVISKIGQGHDFNGNYINHPCKLRLGYTSKYMTANIVKIEVVDGKDTDLHIDKPVYAIHLTDVREDKNDNKEV